MNWFAFATASAIVFGLSTTLFKVNGMRGGKDIPFLLGLYTTGSLVFLGRGLMEGSLSLSASALFWGLFIGLGSWGGNVLFLKAIQTGPAALTSPFVNLSSLFVILISVVGYGEVLTPLQWGAAFSMVVALVLLPLANRKNGSIEHPVWFVLVIGAAIAAVMRNGGLKITEESGLSNDLILVIGYLFSLAMCALDRIRGQWTFRNNPAIRLGLLAGFLSAGGLLLYAAALATGPGSLAGPIFSGYGVVVVLLSILVLKERLNRKEVLCLLLFLTGFFALKLI